MPHSAINPNLKEFEGLAALYRALVFLSIHLFIAIILTLIFGVVLLAANERSRWPADWIGKIRFVCSELAYVFAFAMFGVVTAFFLSLGLKRGDSEQSANGLIESFAAPFISMLTAAAVFVTSRGGASGSRPARTAICVTCFLCSAAISYRTFFYQILTAF